MVLFYQFQMGLITHFKTLALKITPLKLNWGFQRFKLCRRSCMEPFHRVYSSCFLFIYISKQDNAATLFCCEAPKNALLTFHRNGMRG